MMKGFCFYNSEWHAARPEWSSSRKMDRQKAKAFRDSGNGGRISCPKYLIPQRFAFAETGDHIISYKHGRKFYD